MLSLQLRVLRTHIPGGNGVSCEIFKVFVSSCPQPDTVLCLARFNVQEFLLLSVFVKYVKGRHSQDMCGEPGSRPCALGPSHPPRTSFPVCSQGAAFCQCKHTGPAPFLTPGSASSSVLSWGGSMWGFRPPHPAYCHRSTEPPWLHCSVCTCPDDRCPPPRARLLSERVFGVTWHISWGACLKGASTCISPTSLCWVPAQKPLLPGPLHPLPSGGNGRTPVFLNGQLHAGTCVNRPTGSGKGQLRRPVPPLGPDQTSVLTDVCAEQFSRSEVTTRCHWATGVRAE